MIVIGKNAVLEILKSTPKDINKIIFMRTLKPEKRLKEIVLIAKENGIALQSLSKFDFAKYFNRKNKDEGISQGVVGFMKEFEYTILRDLLNNIKEVKNPLIIVLDEITDPHNLGAIIRSAVCLGADGIVIPRHNSAEINHTVFKTSSGAAKLIPVCKETNISNSILYLKQNGFTAVGADAKTKSLLYEVDFKRPIALVLGSEGYGLREGITENCDELVRIPMAGKIDSLNVSVSAGVFLYEIFRQKQI